MEAVILDEASVDPEGLGKLSEEVAQILLSPWYPWALWELPMIRWQRRQRPGLIYRWLCRICRHYPKVDDYTPFLVLPKGQGGREIPFVGRTASIVPGCSFYLEEEMARHDYIPIQSNLARTRLISLWWGNLEKKHMGRPQWTGKKPEDNFYSMWMLTKAHY